MCFHSEFEIPLVWPELCLCHTRWRGIPHSHFSFVYLSTKSCFWLSQEKCSFSVSILGTYFISRALSSSLLFLAWELSACKDYRVSPIARLKDASCGPAELNVCGSLVNMKHSKSSCSSRTRRAGPGPLHCSCSICHGSSHLKKMKRLLKWQVLISSKRRNMLASHANFWSECSPFSTYCATDFVPVVIVSHHRATPLTYLWYAGLRVAVFLLRRFQLMVAGVTGHHVVRQAAHFSHTEAPFARFRTLDVEQRHKTKTRSQTVNTDSLIGTKDVLRIAQTPGLSPANKWQTSVWCHSELCGSSGTFPNKKQRKKGMEGVVHCH